mmetsp:Transcript_106060/g.342115  ORF Transcript_106060/g.342115 Transcript_106060/m.342115 type:complete len:224 (+) Transcript_106060:215-886(+)
MEPEHQQEATLESGKAGASASGQGRRCINVAVTGKSGSGKSSFINAVLGLRPQEPDAARVGVGETTMQPASFDFPFLPETKLWDLPGLGTTQFPSATYTRCMGLVRFDVVILITVTHGTPEEQILAELKSNDVPYFVVRSKVDIDIDNNNFDYDVPEEETLASIREDMKSRGIVQPYLISSRNVSGFDMDQLTHDLVQALCHVRLAVEADASITESAPPNHGA